MADFVLIPGAGGNASYWDWLVPELTARGHSAVAVDIPEDDPALGLADWAACVVQAAEGLNDVVLVAQSLGGFVAPIAAELLPTRTVVLLNAMIPLSGERPDDWWGATESATARLEADQAAGRATEFSAESHFFHDIEPDRLAELMSGPPPREPSATAMADKCEFTAWPADVRVVVATDDRFFPAEFSGRSRRSGSASTRSRPLADTSPRSASRLNWRRY